MKKKKQAAVAAVNNFVAKNMAKFTRHQIHEKSYKASRKLNKQNLKRENLDSGFGFYGLA
ncbi:MULTISPECIES: hypothetical protein [Testudinibacter]|uniref:Uncharacterized protein n=1 Tax=Testudinibacter aquarius TaxID=1524974 RepID=A0A4R3Y6T7_9PAST|nr:MULTISPECIES: hypothetical protein [Testudinibacter]TNG95585.1 hypothetical protein FHQ20_06400 [Pasteurellaceae bacterium USgator41]TNG96276.1 hypothetical protein FHQ19_02460 [Pasteurellaceae bacterium UScroc12]TNG98848.1 hypothetical protein FHQ24_07525 [Pasteurellaceae bacterium UScroc31]TNG99186.1 hypothetical protein FHQ28_10945 [Pasteurellaceae bacterium USgator11]TNH05624.1 hypothetical protein FHQ22_00500 [Pasteurellaceae bacterium Phil31]TNH05980.1 hypothetical protein FHQ30_0946